jgi:hypothetical protein
MYIYIIPSFDVMRRRKESTKEKSRDEIETKRKVKIRMNPG